MNQTRKTEITISENLSHVDKFSHEYSMLLEEILKGIPDIVKVYKPDYSILFFNQAGYDFYDKTPSAVVNKKCYEILDRTEKCTDCAFEKAITTKLMLSIEKYVPEHNTYMDACFNPILNEAGDVIFVVERLRDITDKKILHNILKKNEEMYRDIINASPDSIIITQDYKIVLSNTEACDLINTDYKSLNGESIYDFFPTDYRKFVCKRIRHVLKMKKKKVNYDYTFTTKDNKKLDLQISSSYLLYEGRPAILSVIRDITHLKRDLNHASELQNRTLQKTFPIPDKIKMEFVYMPLNTISGDFFRLYKVNENLVLGIIVDVSGNGLTAALSISAFDVLFLQEVLVTHDPRHLLKNLNIKLSDYLGEKYIAACCFSFDFVSSQANIVGAGINEFILHRNKNKAQIRTIKGSFLGMFDDSIFDEQIIHFEKGDKFYFFTDGLDFIFNDNKLILEYIENVRITTFKQYITDVLDNTRTENGSLEDDSTMLALEIL